MFSQVCVKNSVHRGVSVRHPQADTPSLGRYPPGRHPPLDRHPMQTPPWTDTRHPPLGRHLPGRPRGYTPHGETPPEQTPPRQTPPWADIPQQMPPSQQMATAVDGAHPTGMHSCNSK